MRLEACGSHPLRRALAGAPQDEARSRGPVCRAFARYSILRDGPAESAQPCNIGCCRYRTLQRSLAQACAGAPSCPENSEVGERVAITDFAMTCAI